MGRKKQMDSVGKNPIPSEVKKDRAMCVFKVPFYSNTELTNRNKYPKQRQTIVRCLVFCFSGELCMNNRTENQRTGWMDFRSLVLWDF